MSKAQHSARATSCLKQVVLRSLSDNDKAYKLQNTMRSSAAICNSVLARQVVH